MFGYRLVAFDNPFLEYHQKKTHFKIAEPEKTILDYFYINARLKTEEEIIQVRIDPDIFNSDINRDKLFRYLKEFKNKLNYDYLNKPGNTSRAHSFYLTTMNSLFTRACMP